MTTVAIPSAFTLACYRLALEAVEELHLPPFKGSALRGGFGHTFKRLACMESPRCDKQCRRGNACAYGYIFETAPPQDSQVLSTFSAVPRPFVIGHPDDHRQLIPAGERLDFGLTLVGQGINHLPYFIVVFRELGRIGLGRSRGQYRLLAIEAVSPGEERQATIYRAEDETIRADELLLNSQAIAARSTGLSPHRLTLDFLTPTRLKHRGRWVMEGPPFEALVKVLLGRVSSLSYFHCDQRWEVDFRGLIERAAGVRSSPADTHWPEWSRVSGRQKQRIKLGGLMGRVTYEGPLADYLPLLALGELIHAGKGTVFGNGQYGLVRG